MAPRGLRFKTAVLSQIFLVKLAPSFRDKPNPSVKKKEHKTSVSPSMLSQPLLLTPVSTLAKSYLFAFVFSLDEWSR